MSVSLRPIIIHTTITGIGALATRFYNGQTPLSKFFFGESPTPIPAVTGAVFGAYSVFFFHIATRITKRTDREQVFDQPYQRVLKKMQYYAFSIYTGILAASIFTQICSFPLSFKTSLILSAAMIGIVVEIMLIVLAVGIIVASGVAICLACMYSVRWLHR